MSAQHKISKNLLPITVTWSQHIALASVFPNRAGPGITRHHLSHPKDMWPSLSFYSLAPGPGKAQSNIQTKKKH